MHHRQTKDAKRRRSAAAFGCPRACVSYVSFSYNFFETIAISVDSEVKALPATSEYNSSALKPFSSNSFLSESLL